MRKPAAFEQPIFVTRPILPPQEELNALLAEVWSSQWLTNFGAKHQALEARLSEFLGAKHLSLVNNGTIALLLICKALDLTGEVITTPFTFPATPHALVWSGLTPVFADIHPETLTLDPARVEAAITDKTSGILGVHVYGMPCDVQALQAIATTHGLKVLYDGAHAFGTRINGESLLSFGDATALSFHATKLFHTVEGGAVASRNQALKSRIDLMRNFGIADEVRVLLPGINGKLNELQAAVGLAVFKLVESETAARGAMADIYRERLNALPGIMCFTLPPGVSSSRQYFVIRVGSAAPITRDELYERLKAYNVFARRYFFPLCSELPVYAQLPSAQPKNLPVAHRVASEVLCLPFYGELGRDATHRVCDIIEYVTER